MPSCTTKVLFSRYQDGFRPVKVVEGGWEVPTLTGEQHLFTTAQSLLRELTGHPRGRGWSADRYFRVGKYVDRERERNNVLDLVPVSRSPITQLRPLVAPPLVVLRDTSLDISIPAPARPSRNRSVTVSGPVGIDLASRGHEVKKLLFAGFGHKIFSSGYDPEDVLQEVYRGLLARNQGRCPWDPGKSSFGHYVHMVCSCVVSNYHRKQRRRRQFEQRYYPGGTGEERDIDVAASPKLIAPETAEQSGLLLGEVAEDLIEFIHERGGTEARLVIKVLPYVTKGTPRAQVAEALGMTVVNVNRAVAHLRILTQSWFRTT